MWWEKHLVEALLRIAKQPHGLWLIVWWSSGIDGKIDGGRWLSNFVKWDDHHCTTQDVDFGSIALHFPGTNGSTDEAGKLTEVFSCLAGSKALRIPGLDKSWELNISPCSRGATALLREYQAKVIGANITREITLGGAGWRLEVFPGNLAVLPGAFNDCKICNVYDIWCACGTSLKI